MIEDLCEWNPLNKSALCAIYVCVLYCNINSYSTIVYLRITKERSVGLIKNTRKKMILIINLLGTGNVQTLNTNLLVIIALINI